jgi:hypothetical protein
VSTISGFPQASPIRLGQTLASSRLTNGTANVSGVFQFENTNTVPPGGISDQPVRFRPDLWYLDELKFNVQVQVWTNIPLINVPASLTGYVGKAFSHVVEASDGPSRFSAAGLPEGLSMDPVTGEIRGIPTGTGTFPIEVSAQNASAPSGLGKFTLRIVRGTPEIRTAPTALTLRSGQPLSASPLLRGEATNALGVVAGKFSWLIPDRRPAACVLVHRACVRRDRLSRCAWQCVSCGSSPPPFGARSRIVES